MGRIELPSMVYETIALPLSYIGIGRVARSAARQFVGQKSESLILERVTRIELA